ncbi:metalloprotease TIKI1-like [Watersipora subatra]|uniref:metalloprotease TIKI1-like n=1 Tax=Watersipora subatra TaxID=2589382 RepID=UPI00355C6B0F
MTLCTSLSHLSWIFVFFNCLHSMSCDEIVECSTNSEQSELNSFLWTLERDPPSYFFGTIHVPYTRVWDYIPRSTKNAFRYSDNVFFELDLTESSTATALANCQLLPKQQTISEFIPHKLYRRLKRYMEYIRRKIPDWMGDEHGRENAEYYADYQYRAIVGSWQRMKPVWLMLLLNSLTENDVKLFGVPVLDLYLSRQAVEWEKNVGAIELAEEQCAPLNKLNSTQVIFALDQTLKQHEDRREKSQSIPDNSDLIKHYNCGDLKSVLLQKDTLKIDLKAMQQEQPKLAEMAKEMDKFFVDELLYKRNERMATRTFNLLQDNPNESFFFAFGAGHFLGNNSVIEKLVSLGMPIKHTKPESLIQSHAKRESSIHGAFSHIDSSLIASQPYIDAMKKLDQFTTFGKSTRHGKKRDRKKARRERLYNKHNNKEADAASFTKSFIKVEEISHVTETNVYGLLEPQTSLSAASVQRNSGSFLVLLACLILVLVVHS